MIAAPHPLNLVCFRHVAGDEANQAIMDEVNQSGELYLSHCKLNGELTLRLCVGQADTTREHLRRAWQRIGEAAKHW